MLQSTINKDSAPLAIEHIRQVNQNAEIGHTILYFHSVTSTMAIAHELACDPATRSGTLIVAEEQSSGRGRRSRSWLSPACQSILYSLLLRGDSLPDQPALLMMMAGLAAVEAIIQVAPALAGQCGLKWPNDILLGVDRTKAQKVGGILIESKFEGARLAYAVVGMGINVHQKTEQLPPIQAGAPEPTSLLAFTGSVIDRSLLLIELTRQWQRLLLQSQQDCAAIFQQWRALLWTIGNDVVVVNAGQAPLAGLVIDVEPSGALLLQTQDGQIQQIHAGDVSLRKFK